MIETNNLSFSYNNDEGGVFILRNINLTIKDGEFVSIIGRNGSGKSTLVKVFNALNLPTDGEVFVDSLKVSEEENLYQIRQNVGMVFQNPENQIVGTTVEDDVAFALENLGVPRDEMVERVHNTIDYFGLTDKKQSEPYSLSGGEKQRLAIASVMAMRPRHLILDEPTAMLDPYGRKQVMDKMFQLHKNGMTIILISHHMEEVLKTERTIFLQNGEIVFDGTPEAFFLSKEIKNSDIEAPPIFQLQKKLKKKGVLKSYCKNYADIVADIMQ